MEIPSELLTVFSGQVRQKNGSYVIEVPERELDLGTLETGGVYRVALLGADEEPSTDSDETASTSDGSSTTPSRSSSQGVPAPPVEPGDRRTVEIEDIGEQGDGIARVERGYVVIVPDTEMRERVTVEITDVKQTVGFAEVVEREDYYD